MQANNKLREKRGFSCLFVCSLKWWLVGWFGWLVGWLVICLGWLVGWLVGLVGD